MIAETTTTDASSAQDAKARSVRRWGWAILLFTNGISLAFNIGHAVHSAPRPPTQSVVAQAVKATEVPMPLALMYGIAPVVVALLLSHLIAIQNGGWFKRIITGLVFGAAMTLSVRAISEELNPLAGNWGLLFALMLDVAALLALNEVLTVANSSTVRTQEVTPVPHRATEPPATVPATVPPLVLPTVPAAGGTARMTVPPDRATEPGTVGRAGSPTVPPNHATESDSDRSAEASVKGKPPELRVGVTAPTDVADAAREIFRRSLAGGQPLTDRRLVVATREHFNVDYPVIGRTACRTIIDEETARAEATG